MTLRELFNWYRPGSPSDEIDVYQGYALKTKFFISQLSLLPDSVLDVAFNTFGFSEPNHMRIDLFTSGSLTTEPIITFTIRDLLQKYRPENANSTIAVYDGMTETMRFFVDNTTILPDSFLDQSFHGFTAIESNNLRIYLTSPGPTGRDPEDEIQGTAAVNA